MQITRVRFSKSHRLTNGSEFRETTQLGRRFRDNYFSVHSRTNNLSQPRLGITVSRRVSKKAVVRNRIKRCVRECFRLNQERLIGVDLVVVAQPSAAASSTGELRTSLQRLWLKSQSYA